MRRESAAERGFMVPEALLALVVLAAVGLILVAALLPARRPRTRPDPTPLDLAVSKCEELRSAPAGSPELHVPDGDPSATYVDAPNEPIAYAGARPSAAPAWIREWTVEPLRVEPLTGSWTSVPGGARYDVKRVTVRVRPLRTGAEGRAPGLITAVVAARATLLIGNTGTRNAP